MTILRHDKPQYCLQAKNAPFDQGVLAEKMVAEMLPAIQKKAGGTFSFKVGNCDRSIGARLSGEIAKVHGDLGMSDAPLPSI
jgi:glutamate synthase (NADPH/NADH) large chain